ncbi:hypothetical protein BJ138DRAFT_1053460 [Hygrophoropsis aurantiaca]|uniref:Uncharacterized protein n=1 Tax=Hygrophoropsis aurantiaca TaxID=72124 RepID=A0ACB8ATB4_9AGAM|nr:hypothetical protein BJ138DRAFT_1053460 [Hygrophoropsis aurantiaca]
MADTDQQRLLELLHAHGQKFLDSFDLPSPPTKKRKTHENHALATSNVVEAESDEEESEWLGFGGHGSKSSYESDNETDNSFDQGDDGFTASSSTRLPDVIVFSDTQSKSAEKKIMDTAQKKAFMSSKASKVTAAQIAGSSSVKKDDDVDEERTNLQNDAILHRLLHTKLLSGSLHPDLNLSHAQREKALAGRVLELSGSARLGKGEKITRETERNKAAKRVREGLLRKKEERDMAQIEEAKNLGNYHPSLKKLYDSEKSETGRKKRDRGLGMGIGRFSGGTLTLSREEINSVTGRASRGGRGRGSRGQSNRGRGRK